MQALQHLDHSAGADQLHFRSADVRWAISSVSLMTPLRLPTGRSRSIRIWQSRGWLAGVVAPRTTGQGHELP
jgi:hypothetical protein